MTNQRSFIQLNSLTIWQESRNISVLPLSFWKIRILRTISRR